MLLDKWAIYDKQLPDINGKYKPLWVPHDGQLIIAEDNHRHKVVAAGRRFGKSNSGGVDKLLPEVFYTKPIANQLLMDGRKRIFWIVGPTFCTDDQTEILTQRGWLRYNEVQIGDQTLGMKEDGTVEWTDVLKVNVFAPQQHSMISMEMRGHSSLTTPNHKWLVEYGSQNYGDGQRHVLGTRFVDSQNLGKANERVICARSVTNLPETPKYTDDLVELVAWYWTEGYYRGPGIEIAQAHFENLEKWKSLQSALISEFGEAVAHGALGNVFYVKGEQAQAIWQHAPGKEKNLTWDFIMSLTKAQLRLFIEISVDADGHYRYRGNKGNERIVVQKYKHNLDVLQMACQLYGWQSNLRYDDSGERWVLQIFERNQFAPASAKRYGKMKTVDYDGIVWCPTTSTHTWLARRNGTVYFTGNSDSEKEFRVIWNMLKKLEIPMDKPSYNNPESGDMVITLWGGAMQIIAKSAQIPERLVGEGLSGVILSEAAKLKEHIWPKFIRPTLGDFGGWSYSSSTPEGKNWFYRLWQQGQDPSNKQWRSWRMPAWRNQYVYTETGRQIAIGKLPPDTPIPEHEFTKDSDVYGLLELSRRTSKSIYKLFDEGDYNIDIEILDSMNELTPEAFLQEICADFTEFVGRVFKEFDEETHVTDLQYNPAWETYAAVDYGYCVDTETEILTKDGWKRYDEISCGTECLTLNTKTKLAEWGYVQDVKVFEGDWDMVRMESKSHSSFTTSNHRWFTKWLGNQKNWDWRWTTSDNFKDNDYVPTALPVSNLPETQKYSDALVELVAWYWTEGSRWSKDVGNHRGSLLGGEITQNFGHQSAKIRRALTALYGEADKAGMRLRIPKWYYAFDDRKDFGGSFKLNGPALAPILECVIGYDKIVSTNFIAALTRSQLDLFINTSIEADGSKTGASYIISQAKWQRLEPLQMACQLAGVQTVLRKQDNGYGSLTLFERYKQFNPKRIARQERWTGKVWCPTTNNGTWLARRNGTVYFTGNCNPNVWLLIQVGPWNEINVLDEIYEEGLDPEDFADEIRWRRLNPANLRTFYPDPADPLSTKILEKKLRIRAGGGTGGELLSRINHIRKALRNPRYVIPEAIETPSGTRVFNSTLEDGSLRPQLMFDRRCKRTIEDMLNYRYPEKKADTETSTDRHEKPMKKADHGPEALGRFFAGHFGQYGKPHTRARVHQANFSEKNAKRVVYADDLQGPLYWTKEDKYTRPLLDEKRREDFPVVNDPLENLFRGDYDSDNPKHKR